MNYPDDLINKIICGDCLKVMLEIPDGVVDMVLCDLPYGQTRNKWDSVIDLQVLWVEYKRIIKERGAIVLTAQTPFDKVLGCSNLEWLRYEWVWVKNKPRGFLNANRMPLRNHENVLVFYERLSTYNPQKTTGHDPVHSYTKHTSDGSNYGATRRGIEGGGQTDRYPLTVQEFRVVDNDGYGEPKLHPTQKPVALFEYLIKTYTNEGDLVLDNCVGSGTTAVACKNTGRDFIGIDIYEEYCEIAERRLMEV